MENPIERLRNKLSPFMNLVKMLDNGENDLKPFNNEKLNDIVRLDFEVCVQNLPEIHRHLAQAEEFIYDPDERHKYTKNHIITNLPKTIDADLHLMDAAVNSFIQMLSRVKDDNYLPVIDEMFMHYTKVIQDQLNRIIELEQNSRYKSNNSKNDWEGSSNLPSSDGWD